MRHGSVVAAATRAPQAVAARPFWIDAGAEVIVELANGGTTNAELAPYCGQAMQLSVYLRLVDTQQDAAPWTSTQVTIACP